VLRLHTFGGVYVSDDAGEPLSGAATQRRLLALLSVLASGGDGGLSRDKLVGLLWPETDIERARHSLTQALYSARKVLRSEELFDVSSGNVRLRPEQLTSDVRDFEQALERGELELAVSLYEGAFLDGFFVSGAPEFEQWITARRSRLQGQVAAALDTLAERAEADHDHAAAVQRRRQLAGLLPLDSASTAKLMAALANAGDRAGAIRQAQVHAALLRDELDIDPAPVVAELEAALRVTNGAASESAELKSEWSNEAGALPEAAEVQPLPQSPRIRESEGRARIVRVASRFRLSPSVRWGTLAVILLGLIGAAVALERARRSAAADMSKLAVRQRVVVAPFRVAGATPSLAYLRDGMVELLSTRLADDSMAQSVDAGAVLGAWRSAGLAADLDISRQRIVELANRLGAERVVVGSVVGSPARTVLSAAVLTVPGGVVSGQATITGSADSIFVLIDRLAVRLLLSEAGQDDDLAHSVSRSPAATRAFLAGQTAFRRGDFARAVHSYGTALRRDSTFALAALYQALAGDRLGLDVPLRAGVAIAWISRDELSERDRARLLALSGPRFPHLPTGAELAVAWQHAVDLAPENADSWYELALRLMHDGGAAGIANARERAAAALQRALAVDSTHREARALLSGLRARERVRSVPSDGTVPRRAVGTTSIMAPSTQWLSAIASDDTLALQHLRASYRRLDTPQLRAIAMASQLMLTAPEDGARTLALFARSAVQQQERVDAILAEHSFALNRGEQSRAVDATSRLRRVQGGPRGWLRLRVLDGMYGDGDTTVAGSAARTLHALVGESPLDGASTSEGWLADACVLAQWRLQHADTTQVQSTIARLRAWDRRLISPVASAAPLACAELLDAWMAVVLRAPDARARVARLDSLAFTPQVAGDAHAYAPIVIARLYERLGDAPAALRALREGAPSNGWPRYLAAMTQLESELAAAVGDSSAAQAARRRYREFRVDKGR
jgi:DNA-binding SARP family transcriptional activator